MRILVAGVGYGNLRDMSAGPEVIERLRRRSWPEGVQVEDMSYGAVAALHWFQEQPPFDGAIFVTAAQRGRKPGSVAHSAWTGLGTTGEDVQTRMAEAVTGTISLDTLLTVVAHFHGLPPRVHVIEIEPRDHTWGPSFSPTVETAMAEAETLIERDVDSWLA